jgi:hypothetical protein
MASSTLTFSSRTLSASKLAGGSMHSSVSSWSMWFCTRSRSAPRRRSSRARADAEVLGGGDLDVVDVVAVPHRLEQEVGEAEREDVLHRLLAEVVVDAEDLRLAEGSRRRVACSARARARSLPNGFSTMTRTSTCGWRFMPAVLSDSMIVPKYSGAVER